MASGNTQLELRPHHPAARPRRPELHIGRLDVALVDPVRGVCGLESRLLPSDRRARARGEPLERALDLEQRVVRRVVVELDARYHGHLGLEREEGAV